MNRQETSAWKRLVQYLLPGGWLILRGRRLQGGLAGGLCLGTATLLILQWPEVFGAFQGSSPWDWFASLYLIGLFLTSFLLNAFWIGDSQILNLLPLKQGFRRIRKNRTAIAGLIFLFLAYSIAILAPLVAPHDPIAQEDVLRLRLLPPSLESGFLLGTDAFGRGILSRMIFGARISLFIGFVAVGIAVIVGTAIGLVAGYFGGVTDSLLMRFVDLMLGFPRLFLILIIIAFTGPSILWTVLVLGLTGWMGLARIVRGETLSLREREYIQAARALGIGTPAILVRHLLPNLLPPIIVFAVLNMGNVILIEAGLSFLGLGVQPPDPSWGNMVNLGRQFLMDAWWISTFPGLAIVGTVISFNLAGDGLQEAFDPKSQR